MTRDLFGRVAARFNAAARTGCTAGRLVNGKLVVQHPVYAGKAMVEVELAADRLNVVTFRGNSFANPVASATPGQIGPLSVELADADLAGQATGGRLRDHGPGGTHRRRRGRLRRQGR